MPTKLSDKTLAVLGTGKLGSILLRAYLKQGLFAPKRVTATVRHEERPRRLQKGWRQRHNRQSQSRHGADIVLLAVKPQWLATS